MKKNLLTLVAVAALAALPLIAQTFPFGGAAVPIPDNTGAFGACQTINVTGTTGVIQDVTVQVTSSHSWIGDLTVRLTAPNASVLTLLNRPGRTGAGAGNSDDLQTATPITYSDTAVSGVSAEAMGTACAGTINGTAGCENNYTPAPDAADTPIAGQGTNFAQFDGISANGNWVLCVADSALGDTGTLTTWSITVTTPVELESFTIE